MIATTHRVQSYLDDSDTSETFFVAEEESRVKQPRVDSGAVHSLFPEHINSGTGTFARAQIFALNPHHIAGTHFSEAVEEVIDGSFFNWITGPNKGLAENFFRTIVRLTTPIHGRVKLPYENPVYSFLQQQVDAIVVPKKWAGEGIAPPTIDCKKRAFQISAHIYKKYHLVPLRVTASVEEGIMLLYKHSFFTRTLHVEIYNDSDVAALVNEKQSIVSCEAINGLDFGTIIEAFNA